MPGQAGFASAETVRGAEAMPSAASGASPAQNPKAAAMLGVVTPSARGGADASKPDAKADAKSEAHQRAAVIIYQGEVRMLTEQEEVAPTIDKIVDIAEGVGGHISGRKDLSVQVKVPSARFRETLSKIDALGGVVGRSVSADDVTEEFHDIEVRLANLRTTRARLQEFMGKANSIADMLTVERELERVAQEIDRLEGRLQFLRTRAAMSTIQVAFTAKPKPAPIVVAERPPPPPPPPPPKASAIDVPVQWVKDIGLRPLLILSYGK
jgi:hypothetical protein